MADLDIERLADGIATMLILRETILDVGIRDPDTRAAELLNTEDTSAAIEHWLRLRDGLAERLQKSRG